MRISEIISEVRRGNKMSNLKLISQVSLNSSINALVLFRLAQWSYHKKLNLIALLLKRKLERRFGVFISLNTEISEGLKLPHATSIVIGDGVKIGENVTIYQQVTLGGQRIGDGKENNYPVIGNDVVIYSGAKVIGKVTIGNGAVIGANSVVITDVEPYSVYAGVPAKRIDKKEN